MNTHHRIRRCATALLAFGLAACGRSDEGRVPVPAQATPQTAGALSDIELTTRVKTALVQDILVQGYAISVGTRQGKVKLSGAVGSRAQIEQALKVARAVTGVREVRDGMTFQP